MINKKNLPLYIALAVPVLMIGLVAALVYIPAGFVHPKYSFVYSSGGNYPYDQFVVQNQKLMKNSRPANADDTVPKYAGDFPEPKLFFYDIEKNESREIALDEAMKYKLDSTNQSPDGYEIPNGNYGGGLFDLFGGGSRDYNARYISGHGGSKKLNIKTDTGANYYDPYSFQLLGWVVQ